MCRFLTDFPWCQPKRSGLMGKTSELALYLLSTKRCWWECWFWDWILFHEIVKVGNTDFHCNKNWQILILLVKCQRQLYNVYTRPFCVKTTHVCLNRWKPNIDSMTCIELFTLLNSFPFFSKIRNSFFPKQNPRTKNTHERPPSLTKDGKNESFWMIMSCRLKNVDYSGKRVTNNLFCSRRGEGKERLLLLRTSDETTTSTDISTALL